MQILVDVVRTGGGTPLLRTEFVQRVRASAAVHACANGLSHVPGPRARAVHLGGATPRQRICAGGRAAARMDVCGATPSSGCVCAAAQGINDIAAPFFAAFLGPHLRPPADAPARAAVPMRDCTPPLSPAAAAVLSPSDALASMECMTPAAAVRLQADVALAGVAPAALVTVEADVYWCLTRLLDNIQDHYTPGQPGLQRMLARTRELVRGAICVFVLI